jgi:hypothetical protein
VSGDSAIRLSKTFAWNSLNKGNKSNFLTSLAGTAVRMNIDTLELGNVEARLAQFRKEAPQIANRVLGRAPRSPSYMSLLLRKDFKES